MMFHYHSLLCHKASTGHWNLGQFLINFFIFCGCSEFYLVVSRLKLPVNFGHIFNYCLFAKPWHWCRKLYRTCNGTQLSHWTGAGWVLSLNMVCQHMHTFSLDYIHTEVENLTEQFLYILVSFFPSPRTTCRSFNINFSRCQATEEFQSYIQPHKLKAVSKACNYVHHYLNSSLYLFLNK